MATRHVANESSPLWSILDRHSRPELCFDREQHIDWESGWFLRYRPTSIVSAMRDGSMGSTLIMYLFAMVRLPLFVLDSALELLNTPRVLGTS
jgi:hypothetical protein